MKVTVYNIKKLIENHLPAYTIFNVEKVAIICKDNETIISEGDAVHYVFQSNSEKFDIQLSKREASNVLQIIPAAHISVQIQTIIDKAEHEDMELDEFIRPFGARIKNNYQLLLESIEK